MLENALSDFGKRMNMPTFALNDKGLAALKVGETCFLNFEKTHEELLLYISAPAATYDELAPLRVLDLAHYKNNYPFPFYAGLYNDTYVLLTRFPEKEVSAALIENAFQFLLNQLNKAQGQ